MKSPPNSQHLRSATAALSYWSKRIGRSNAIAKVKREYGLDFDFAYAKAISSR